MCAEASLLVGVSRASVPLRTQQPAGSGASASDLGLPATWLIHMNMGSPRAKSLLVVSQLSQLKHGLAINPLASSWALLLLCFAVTLRLRPGRP